MDKNHDKEITFEQKKNLKKIRAFIAIRIDSLVNIQQNEHENTLKHYSVEILETVFGKDKKKLMLNLKKI